MRLAGVALLAFAPFGAAQAATVLVTVEGVETAQGTINIGVCDKSLSQEGCPYHTTRPATPGAVQARFDNIPPGRYAIVAYHDINGNNTFDQFLGIPQEPFALSNNAGESLVPTFGQAALNIGDGVTRVTIRLQRFLNR